MALGKLWRYMKRYEKDPLEGQEQEKERMEKSDVPAMMLAALLVFLPVTLLILAVVIGIPLLFFLR